MRTLSGGMASRKFLYAIGTSLLIFTGALLAAWWPALGLGIYELLITGLLGALGLYLGGNVTSKLVTARQIKAPVDDEPPAK